MVFVGLRTSVVAMGRNPAAPTAAETNVAHQMKSVVIVSVQILKSVAKAIQ